MRTFKSIIFSILVAFMLLPFASSAQSDKVYTSLSDVKDPSEVYILKLHYKRLRRIPPQIFTYHNLRVLDLSKNFIDTISPEISKLQNLEELDLERNHIHNVPDAISSLSHLRSLNLSRNPILELPESMAQLSHLEQLVIWSTGIVSFPPTFVVLDATLQLIDMRVCPMTYENQEAIEELLPTPRKRWDYVCNCK